MPSPSPSRRHSALPTSIAARGPASPPTVDARPVVQVQPVSAIPPAIKKPQRLIEGNGEVATGVMTQTSAIRMEEALTVGEFKTRILNLIEN